MASLTEAAKAVLEGKQIEEGAYPEVSPGKISNPNPVDPSTASTSNAKTLHPNSRASEGRHSQNGKGAPGPEAFPGPEDLGGATPTSVYSDNIGAKASGKNKRDKSVKGSGNNAEPTKKLAAEEMEQDGEVFEEETLTIAERLKALKEARKACSMEEEEIHEDEEIEMSEELEDFIAEAIEAGLSEEEIADAIEENFEFVTEDEEELDEDEQLDEISSDARDAYWSKAYKARTKADRTSRHEKGKALDAKTKKGSDSAMERAEKADEVSRKRTKGLALAKRAMRREELEGDEYQIDMSEHVDALLAGENLSEEFQEKATTIFEAAVKSRLEEEIALLEEAYAETLEERVNEIMEELATNVDDYLNYVVEQWIEENEVAVESALRSELTEDFISGLHALFAEHYIDVPEDTVDVVEELASTVESLEAKLNEEIQRNVELTGVLAESRKAELISAVCEGLTDVQADKLSGLLENVAYTSDEEFIDKIETLRENYFPVAVRSDNVLDRAESANDPQALTEESLEGPMARYVQALGKSLPR